MSRADFETLEHFETQIALRRKAIVFALARSIYSNIQSQFCIKESKELANTWIEIESLSQLRGIVGGRFTTVKAHWMAAGFPLRAHRGDRSKPVRRNDEGWLELSLWLDSQGYTARAADNREPVCFEIRLKSEE